MLHSRRGERTAFKATRLPTNANSSDAKESTRWVESYEIVADLAETLPDTRWVYVADREGDLWALIDAAAPPPELTAQVGDAVITRIE